ncbi:hypothetical protein CCACVL1_29088 [Corchorus capsularis]|uniref:Uncharacterized protein n=1 Tax=Corchorus capsularis TaxID=210143 RepID=A0A1R3G3V4_COCAP|nr:hypothetical protein CCACVL1_29088 [Corchorus capsularis]
MGTLMVFPHITRESKQKTQRDVVGFGPFAMAAVISLSLIFS